MEHLTEVSVEALQRALADVDDGKPTQRLVAAIAYKNGITQSELAEWFDVERKTIYNWLTRLEEQDIGSAIRDAPRSGRPRKLSDDRMDELESILEGPPDGVGYDVPAWTTDLLQACLRDRFGVEYSQSSCRRLMREAGLQPRPVRRAVVDFDADDREAVEEVVSGRGRVWLPR